MRPIFWSLLTVLSVWMTVPGQARARDDVMSGAYRCAIIGDSRQWLDCYYGAAQPVRAQLGMTPAPAGQIRLAQSPPGGNQPGDIGVRDQVIANASNCHSFADDRRWLDCYYGAAQPMRAQLGLSPAPQVNSPQGSDVSASTARSRAGPASPINGGDMPADMDASKAAAQQFGMPPAPPVAMTHSTNRIVSRMTSYSFDNYGIFTVTLANGQTWKQVSGDTDYAHWKKPAATYQVNIMHGFMGSYNLVVQGISGDFKVRRIK